MVGKFVSMSEVKMYFKGGKGILNPVDVDGNEIKEGDILTDCLFDEIGTTFFKKYYPEMSDSDIFKRMHAPLVKVKWDDEGFFYGEGIEINCYMHDFRFKYTKKVNQ